MTLDRKHLLRAAVAVHQKFQQDEPRIVATVELPTGTWRECLKLLGLIRRAAQRGWTMAAVRLQRNLHLEVQRLQGGLSSLSNALASSEHDNRRITIQDIAADLVALQDEFEAVAFDKRANTLSVTTEPIELEGVSLGAFEIRLDWDDVTPGYRVVAQTPNPAAMNEAITHPHVDDECLCEGDARVPIRHALQQGRLFDFFTIVASVLRTYNASSPYVALEDWEGQRCADCGDSFLEDELSNCQNCSTAVCGDCYTVCESCNDICCSECHTSCDSCIEAHCLSCMKSDSRINHSLCPACLAKHERLAKQNAQDPEEIDPTQDEEKRSEEVQDAYPAVQPVRLGEASVSA